MNLILLVLAFCFSEAASAESGDCIARENLIGRNKIFSNLLEVDPCNPVKFQRCILPPSTTDIVCPTSSLDPSTCSVKILISEYNSTLKKAFKVTMVMPIEYEYFIQAYRLNNRTEGNYEYDSNSAERLGDFEDIIFNDCNSYACCDKNQTSRRDVARKCPTAIAPASPAFENSTEFYVVMYTWYPPPTFQGFVIFSGTFFKSVTQRWEKVLSTVVPVNVIIPSTDDSKPLLPAKITEYQSTIRPIDLKPKNKTKKAKKLKNVKVAVEKVSNTEVVTDVTNTVPDVVDTTADLVPFTKVTKQLEVKKVVDSAKVDPVDSVTAIEPVNNISESVMNKL